MTAYDTTKLVRRFHRKFGLETNGLPSIGDIRLNKHRLRLIHEETGELIVALRQGDAIRTLDALTDLQYVLDGTYVSLGFASVKYDAFAEVHRSNLTKVGADGRPMIRSDGKILKGPFYDPPQLEQFVRRSKP